MTRIERFRHLYKKALAFRVYIDSHSKYVGQADEKQFRFFNGPEDPQYDHVEYLAEVDREVLIGKVMMSYIEFGFDEIDRVMNEINID